MMKTLTFHVWQWQLPMVCVGRENADSTGQPSYPSASAVMKEHQIAAVVTDRLHSWKLGTHPEHTWSPTDWAIANREG